MESENRQIDRYIHTYSNYTSWLMLRLMYVGTGRENKWQEVGINLDWMVRESLHVEATLKLSPKEWEGANYKKGKERAFQAKGTESAKVLWQKRAWRVVGIRRKVSMPRTKPGRKEWHEIWFEWPTGARSCRALQGMTRRWLYLNFQKILLHI